MSSFASVSAVRAGNDRYEAELAKGWDVFGVTNGGYTLSVLGRAMGMLVGTRRLISISGHFLNPATPGPVEIDTQIVKNGRSLDTTTATMSRDGRPLLMASAVHASVTDDQEGAEIVVGEPPDLPPPDDCVRATPAHDAPLPPPLVGQVDVRVHPEDAGALAGNPSGRGRMRGWFRLLNDEPLDPYAIVMASDAFPPPVFNSGLPLGWTPTVDLTVHIHNGEANGWLACRFTTNFVTRGMLEEDGELWDSNGKPVAFSRQLALFSS